MSAVAHTFRLAHWWVTKVRLISFIIILIGIGIMFGNARSLYYKWFYSQPIVFTHGEVVAVDSVQGLVTIDYRFQVEYKCMIRLIYRSFFDPFNGNVFATSFDDLRSVWEPGAHSVMRVVKIPSGVPRDGTDIGYVATAYALCGGVPGLDTDDSAGRFMIALPTVTFKFDPKKVP